MYLWFKLKFSNYHHILFNAQTKSQYDTKFVYFLLYLMSLNIILIKGGGIYKEVGNPPIYLFFYV
jgi:hypothetical protein